jgi:short-subunit dehydrogenase
LHSSSTNPIFATVLKTDMTKVVFITGASSGIGKAIGDYLSEKGYSVYGTSRNPSKYLNSSFPLIAMEVTDKESIERAVSEVLQKEKTLDIVINNAGVGITGPIEETPHDEIDYAFSVNYKGPLHVINACLPQMRKQHSGKIINITSIAGYMGLPYRGIYSATKAALEVTIEAMRMEVLQFGIEMVNVAPGDFATNIAAGRYHTPVRDDSPYRDQYGKTLELMNKDVDSGEDPVQMAKVIYAIITSSKPRVHYKVGSFLQKFSIALKRVLPDRMYERMLMNHYKLK